MGLPAGNIVSMPPSSKRLTAAERRPLIEQAATRLFAERGFAATTVDEIANAAGVTKPILYRHFESKRELCIALLERARADLIAAPLARFNVPPEDRRAQLREMVDAWLNHVERHPDAARLLFTPITGDPEVERVQRELHVRQRDTQVALLREFAPTAGESELTPLGEILRAGFAAVALWRIDDPGATHTAAGAALHRLADGVIGTFDDPPGQNASAEHNAIGGSGAEPRQRRQRRRPL
jgi:AcrR family transcriptional regulator